MTCRITSTSLYTTHCECVSVCVCVCVCVCYSCMHGGTVLDYTLYIMQISYCMGFSTCATLRQQGYTLDAR